MRKIKVSKWKAKNPETKKDIDDSTLTVLGVLIANKKPENMPRGLDKFRLFNRITKAFDKAKETDMLELEETDYKFLKDTIETDIPSIWGTNVNITEAIEDFLQCKEE